MGKKKFVLIGVSGGIATYKVADIISSLKKMDYDVQVIMTKNATEFIHPNTFETLSKNKVALDTFIQLNPEVVEHIDFSQRADIFLVVPTTANVLGKLANGIADDLLTTTLIATNPKKVLIAPAMNTNMYNSVQVTNNIKKLKEMEYSFIDPVSGMLACGDIGIGKLAAVEDIVNRTVEKLTEVEKDLEGQRILITAGPTRESIDPVRFITNHSTGKMGYAIAENAISRGAEVVLISGPTNLTPPKGLSKFVSIISAKELYESVINNLPYSDIIIQSAAVADYRPKIYSDKKIKKKDDDLKIELERTIDIAYEVGKQKENKILVGFAAETNDLTENALKKITKKNLDLIVANDLTKDGAGFGVDTNIVKLIDKYGKSVEYPKLSKKEVSNIILNKILEIKKSS